MSRSHTSLALYCLPAPRRRHAKWLPAALLSLFATQGIAAATNSATTDMRWLNRITFGVDSATLARFQPLGRARFLDEQLAAKDEALPPPIAANIGRLEIERTPPLDVAREAHAEQQRIRAMPDGEAKIAARKALRQHGQQLAYQAASAEMLRAIYSPAQLKEQMTWFWLNHFSVFENKANLRWLVADYSEHAVRPRALGHFRDLVMATLTSPAMLQYLDNARNANGHVNENYARELMELQTLGVGAAYTQADVQQLARILTGVGVKLSDRTPHLKPQWQALYVRDGLFEFNPARHDFGDKVLLGHTIKGSGFDEVKQAVDLIVRQPACAQFVSRKLATYFVADEPPPALVKRMAKTFQHSDGDIAAVLRTLFESRELEQSLGKKFRDPMQYVVASIRLAYDGHPIANPRPVMNWLRVLGEPLFGHLAPDGYALVENAWSGSGQLSRRFDIARAIGSGNATLFSGGVGAAEPVDAFPPLSSKLYRVAIEPHLSAPTKAALERAGSQSERNTFLLASPDANYR